MASLDLRPSLIVDRPAAIYGVKKTDSFTVNDDVALIPGRPGYTLSSLRVTPEIGLLMLQPVALLTDMLLSDYATPIGSWTTATDSETGRKQLVSTSAAPDASFDSYSNQALTQDGSFFFRIQRGQTSASATQQPYTVLYIDTSFAGPGTTATPSQNNGAPCALLLPDNDAPFLQQAIPNPDGSDTWYWPPYGQNGVKSKTIARCADAYLGNARTLTGEWLPVPLLNCLVVTLNGDEKLILRGANQSLAPAGSGTGQTYQYGNNLSVAPGRIRVYGKNGTCAWSYLPMRFAPAGTLTSGTIDIPFTYQGNYIASVYAGNQTYPASGSVAVIADPLGIGARNQLQYQLTMTGEGIDGTTGLASLTDWLTSVHVYIPPTYYAPVTSSPVDYSGAIAGVEEHQILDLETRTLRTTVGIDLDNSAGIVSGPGGQHLAAQYARNLMVDASYYGGSPSQMADYSSPIPLVTGWSGHETVSERLDPHRMFSCIVTDKMWLLERLDIGDFPVLDGWCFLSALRELAFHGNIDYSFMDPLFWSCDAGLNPASCPHFKLPLGVGTSPRVGYHPSTKIRAAMTEILRMVHGLMFFDGGGILRSQSYAYFIANAAYKGTFNAATFPSAGDPSSSDFLSDMWGEYSLGVSTAERRTGVALVGIDPARNETQRTFLNADDQYPGFTANVHGFQDYLYEASNLNVDPVYTAYAAQQILNRTLLPTARIQHRACFLPNLFVLDAYGVTESIAVGGSATLLCEEMRSGYRTGDPSSFGSIVIGRYRQNF